VIRRAAAVILAGLLAALAVAAPMDPLAFRDRLAAAVSSRTGQPVVAVDDRTLRMRTAKGSDQVVTIDEVYARYLANPGVLDTIADEYSQTLGFAVEPSESADQIVVIVRPANYFRRAAGTLVGGMVPPRPLAGDLAYFLSVDTPKSIRPVMKSDLVRWQIGEGAAWRLGAAHIKARVGKLAVMRLGNDKGAVGLGSDSGLAPSVLADPEFCGPKAPAESHGQLVLLYSRDMLLFAPPSDAVLTRTFWRTVKAKVAAGESLSSTPIACRGGGWVVASAPAE